MSYFKNTKSSAPLLAIILGVVLGLLIWTGFGWLLLTLSHIIYPAFPVLVTFWNCFFTGLIGVLLKSIFN